MLVPVNRTDLHKKDRLTGFSIFELKYTQHIIHKDHFFSILSLLYLTDQFLYSHFSKETSLRFKKMFGLAPLALGVTHQMLHPWEIARLCKSHEVFKRSTDFYLNELKENILPELAFYTSWEDVKSLLMNDPDISTTLYGRLFIETLNNF